MKFHPWMRAPILICGLITLALVSLIIGSYIARADVGVVHVAPEIEDSEIIAGKLTARLQPGDDMAIIMLAEDSRRVTVSSDDVDLIVLQTIGNELTVQGNAWVPQLWLQERAARVENVTRAPLDKLLAMIREVHKYQASHPKPPPPPPPPAPPAPPYDWAPVLKMLGGMAIGLTIVGTITVLVRRKVRRRRELLHRAEVQKDWTFEDYMKGMKE